MVHFVIQWDLPDQKANLTIYSNKARNDWLPTTLNHKGVIEIRNYRNPLEVTPHVAITIGGPTSPAKAASPPAMPRKREPNTTDRLTMFGPGKKWHSAKVSLNSSAVIQRCCSTIDRRAQTRTPPKPASDILAKARNSSSRPGWSGGEGTEASGAGAAAGGDSGGMGKI